MILGQVAGLPMFISYASVFIAMVIIAMSIYVMGSEKKRHIDSEVSEKEFTDIVASLTVEEDIRSKGKTGKLKGKTYPICKVETIGWDREADTVIDHPVLRSEHVQLTYDHPGRMIATPLKESKKQARRRKNLLHGDEIEQAMEEFGVGIIGGDEQNRLMDGSYLVLGKRDGARIKLRLDFVDDADIRAAKRRSS